MKTFKSEQPGLDPLQASRVTCIGIGKYHLYRIRESIRRRKLMETRQKSLRMMVNRDEECRILATNVGLSRKQEF